LTCIDELVDDVEDIHTFVCERYLALGSFREGSVKGATKVVGVEDEKILVNDESLFLGTDLDCDGRLETTSEQLSATRVVNWAVKKVYTVVESSTEWT
jgi:hypothetical protein